MASMSEYFARRDADMPKPKFEIGDRIFGFYEKIPVVGSVLRDIDREVLVQTDLPVKIEETYRTILKLNQKDVKLLETLKEKA